MKKWNTPRLHLRRSGDGSVGFKPLFLGKQHSVEATAIAIDGDQREDFDNTGDNREDFDGNRMTPVTRPTVLVNHDLSVFCLEKMMNNQQYQN
ncbi:hypothetical protein QYF36_023520 [Acer negundo]|nr:hypothetical protein QYF36_023520 [Acer negundo]